MRSQHLRRIGMRRHADYSTSTVAGIWSLKEDESWACRTGLMMAPSLPHKYVPYVYGILQAAITTAVATAIAIYPLAHSALEFIERWMVAWCIAWLTMLPVVLLAAPYIQRAVMRLFEPDRKADR